MLVENDEIGAEAFEPPVLLRLQHLADECQVVGLHDLDEHDGQVARDAVRPESRLSAAVAREDVWRCAQGFIEIEGSGREAIVLPRGSLEIPKWRRSIWAWVNAIALARAAAFLS